MTRGNHQALIADMRLALLSELGARAVYGGLARKSVGEQLSRLLERLHAEEREQIDRLRALMKGLGGKPRRRSLRRSVAARILILFSRVFGVRFALRVCMDAESTVSRWYAEYARYLAQVGLDDESRECHALGLTKRRHAQILAAWVELLPGR